MWSAFKSDCFPSVSSLTKGSFGDKFLSSAFGIQINNGEHSERGDKRRNYRHWDWFSYCLVLQWWRHNFKVSTSSSMQILLVLRDKIKWKCQTEILWHTLHYLFEFPFYFLVDFIEHIVLIFCGKCHCEDRTLRIFCPFKKVCKIGYEAWTISVLRQLKAKSVKKCFKLTVICFLSILQG